MVRILIKSIDAGEVPFSLKVGFWAGNVEFSARKVGFSARKAEFFLSEEVQYIFSVHTFYMIGATSSTSFDTSHIAALESQNSLTL
jgi:hypothetical protein